MRKIFILLVPALFFYACFKNDDKGCQPVSPDQEASRMAYFCDTSHIRYTRHPSGIFYEILAPGTGDSVQNNAAITINYKAVSLLDNSVFEEATNSRWQLSQLISGWQIGIPLIRKGGHIRLVIPSYYAYGCVGYKTDLATIPPNAPMYFDIQLLDVQQ